METVTSFSASLIQSLGGDTEKAVKYADMAITDMSDNANKMGTDMKSIQNAYQGFAKQNYTMLDNLKLGYGGTKAEMERLLADAQAISGIEYDISSYADIVDAIHIIQTEMGIAGTTALEAEETIQGSLNAFKASFKNLITGFGNADADIGKLTGSLVSSFETVIKNITPVINNMINAFPQIFSAVIPAIGGLLPELLSVASGLFSQVLDTLIKLLPSLMPVAVDAIMLITNTLINNIPLLIDSAITLMLSLSDGLIDALPILIPAAITIIIALASGLIDALPKLIERIPEIVDAIVNSLVDGIPKILEFITQLFISLGTIITETDWAKLGKQIFESVWEGMKNIWNSVSTWVGEKVSWLTDKLAFWRKGNDEMETDIPAPTRGRVDGNHRTGLSYVPFDGYIARTHKGEEIVSVSDKQSIVDILKALTLNNTNNQSLPPIELVVNLNSQVLAKELYDPLENENKLRGTSIAMGV